MSNVDRIPLAEARQHVQSGHAVLVCGYDDEARCGSIRLEGAITMSELQRELPSMPRNTEIIVYCA
jgi:hypothetical protein